MKKGAEVFALLPFLLILFKYKVILSTVIGNIYMFHELPEIKYSVTAKLDLSPVEELLASEDSEDPKVRSALKRKITKIKKRILQGDIWAWVIVEVQAECEGFIGLSIIGGMSYKNEDDFKERGEFQDMLAEAKEALQANLERASTLAKFFKEKSARDKAMLYERHRQEVLNSTI